MRTTAGRVLAAIPMSTSPTSPWRGFITIEDIQLFLLGFARRQHVGPFFLRAMMFKELQIE